MFQNQFECVPECVPSVSQKGVRACASEWVSVSPPLTPLGGTQGHTQQARASESHECVPHPSDQGRSTWLLTPRSKPAWLAVLHLLNDNNWHPTTEVAQAMRDTAALADSTIHNQLRAAGRRQWTTTKRGRTRLRNRHLIEEALDHLVGQS